MTEAAKHLYETISVGGVGWARADGGNIQALESFQSTAAAIDALQEAGLLLIRAVHQEMRGERSLVGAVQFMRVG